MMAGRHGSTRNLVVYTVAGLVLVALLAIVALSLVLGPKDNAEAHSSHPGLNFAIGVDVNGDGTNDCGTGVPHAVGDGAPDSVSPTVTNTTCVAGQGLKLLVNVYLMSNGGIAYEGQASHVLYTGLTTKGRGDAVWAGCVFASPIGEAGL